MENTVPSSAIEATTFGLEAITAYPIVLILGASSYALLSLLSIALNSALVTILVKGHQKYRKVAFFAITWNLVIGDILTQTVQLLVAVPITYAGYPIYGETLFLYAPAFLDTIAYNVTLAFSFVMTANRFAVFLLPAANRCVFGHPQIFITVGLVWAVIIAFVVCLNVAGCHKSFDANGFYMYHDCRQGGRAAMLMREYWGYVTTYLPLAMLAMYMVIYVHLRLVTLSGRRTLQRYRRPSVIEREHDRLRNKGEIKVLLQSFIICGMLEVQNLAFNYLPVLGLSGQWEYVVNFVENWLSILLNTTTPIIIFTFNSEIRSRLKEILGLRPSHEARKATSVRPMQTTVFASTSAFHIRIE